MHWLTIATFNWPRRPTESSYLAAPNGITADGGPENE
jgi:hypothetical protein